MRMHPDELGGPGVRPEDDEEGMGTGPDPMPPHGRTVMSLGAAFVFVIVFAAWVTGGELFAIGFGLGASTGMVITALAVKSEAARG